MEQVKEDITYVKPKRTAFLTVLCILTFLGSAYQILTATAVYLKSDDIAANVKLSIKEDQENAGKPNKPKQNPFGKDGAAFNDVSKMKQSSMFSIAANFITFVGAFMMFFMNTKGFWVYVAGTIMGVAGPLLIFGNNSLASLLAVVPGLIGLAFIVMYAFNLRDMKPQPLYD